jgi:catechol 2,3-dioxygenase-like lactoylglutathione lyase family enzyme
MMSDALSTPMAGLRCLTTMLWVTDLERSIAFYEEKIGATVVRRDHAWNVVSLRLPCGHQLTIRQDLPSRSVTRAGLDAPYVVFQTDNPARDRTEFLTRGITVTELQHVEGLFMFWFADPDNNQFCVLQFIYE